MKEVEKTTAVTIVKAVCDCGGEFIFADDNLLLSNPPMYKYVCRACGKVEQSKTKYPRTIVEEIKRSDGKRKKRLFGGF